MASDMPENTRNSHHDGFKVTGTPALSHAGTEVQPLTYVLRHWETGSKIDLR